MKIENLSLHFGGVVALSGFTSIIYQGEIRGIIGPNGAGKTSLFNLISRFFSPKEGSVYFEDHNLLKYRPHQIIKLGISRTFQKSDLFTSMTVQENIEMGLHIRMGKMFSKKKEEKARQEADQIIDMFNLGDYRDMTGSILPFGIQRLVDLGRAIASRPKLLLLDEAASGMTALEKTNFVKIIIDLRKKMNLTILFVEHDMKLIMKVADRLTVLNYGKIIAEGNPSDVCNNPEVIDAYMGQSAQICN
jgi:branched-chain amino acid transport system ATP-binding protein